MFQEDNDLSFGCVGKQFIHEGDLYNKNLPLLQSHFIKVAPYLSPPEGLETVAKCCQRPLHDTFYEPTLYCFCEGKMIDLLDANVMLHFQNPERFHREEPATYDSVEKLLNVKNRGLVNMRQYIPAVALMFFLSGVYERSSNLFKALQMGDKNFWNEVRCLERRASEWMSEDQLDRLFWATKGCKKVFI